MLTTPQSSASCMAALPALNSASSSPQRSSMMKLARIQYGSL